MILLSAPRPLSFKRCIFYNWGKQFLDNSHMDSRPFSAITKSSVSHTEEAHFVGSTDTTVSLQEWQGWGTTSPVPSMVTEIIEDLKLLQKDIDAPMSFGGNRGKLLGDFKVQEDKRHRDKYESLEDSEKKIQYYSARQIACRVLGSRGYLCQKCWLPQEDCMCSRIMPCSLWNRIQFWLYMHPKDFLRQNNTGKLLWQVFGTQAANLCLYGISEHEETMWNALNMAGRNCVWCLYPNRNVATKSVQDTFNEIDGESNLGCENEKMNFILIDGTWSNSNAMFKRLKDKAQVIWGEEDIPCISLNAGVSSMHKLRPQPSWDRSCTAAAAISLLYELHLVPKLSRHGLESQGEAMENALEALLEALTTRRLRMGRSVSRKARRYNNIC